MPFNRKNLNELTQRIEADITSRLGTGPLLEQSVLGVLSKALGGASHLLHGHLDWITRQVIVDTAEQEYLERWATVWGIRRSSATFATGNISFNGQSGALISAGTRLKRPDGKEFITDIEVTVTAGTATVPVTAVEPGIASNTISGSVLSFISPIAGIQSTGEVMFPGIAGGADPETDQNLRTRLLERIQHPPQGGAFADYRGWALAITGVTRAWVYDRHLGLGTVGVAFVTDDDPSGPVPSSQKVDEVQAYINTLRPVTADVTVFAPIAAPLDLTIGLNPNTSVVQSAVQEGLKDLLRREGEPGGTILISHVREAISLAAGEHDHALITPTINIPHSTGHMPVLGTITWQNL